MQQLRDGEWEEVSSLSWNDAVGTMLKLSVPTCGFGDCFFVEVTDPALPKVNVETFESEGAVHKVCVWKGKVMQGELAVGKKF